MKQVRALTCKILGHQTFDAETLRLQPWTWGEFKGFGADAFAHKHCLRCDEEIAA